MDNVLRLGPGGHQASGEMRLGPGARVGVVGGGPAGALFSYFLLRLARLLELEITVELFEPRDFTRCGPQGCNHCAGVISESLVQALAADGVELPDAVVQRGIDAYVLHTDAGSVRLATPLQEKRVASVFRGNGPRGAQPAAVVGFDAHVLGLAREAGARVSRQRVEDLRSTAGRPEVLLADGAREGFDLLVCATGNQGRLLSALEQRIPGFRPPRTSRAYISEYVVGRAHDEAALGSAMHVFLLDLPRLKFGALIPKGEHATVCLLGEDVDAELVQRFLAAPEVRACFPGGEVPASCCQCYPRINVGAQAPSFGDRLLLLGDCGVTRLYKDGIGAAYRTAKVAAATALLQGVSAGAFARFFGPVCRRIRVDNAIGRLLFAGARLAQRSRTLRRAMLDLARREQRAGRGRRLGGVLWDLFSGSAPYGDVLRRGLSPLLLGGMLRGVLAGPFTRRRRALPARRGSDG